MQETPSSVGSLSQTHFLVWEQLCAVMSTRASGRWRKKVKFGGIFSDKFVEKTASFAEKGWVDNGRFRGSFARKFRWKAIAFALI